MSKEAKSIVDDLSHEMNNLISGVMCGVEEDVIKKVFNQLPSAITFEKLPNMFAIRLSIGRFGQKYFLLTQDERRSLYLTHQRIFLARIHVIKVMNSNQIRFSIPHFAGGPKMGCEKQNCYGDFSRWVFDTSTHIGRVNNWLLFSQFKKEILEGIVAWLKEWKQVVEASSQLFQTEIRPALLLVESLALDAKKETFGA